MFQLYTRLVKNSDRNLKKDEAFIKLIVAPINPAYVNIIQSVYSSHRNIPNFMLVLGSEGLFEIVKVNEAEENVGNLIDYDFIFMFLRGFTSKPVLYL